MLVQYNLQGLLALWCVHRHGKIPTGQAWVGDRLRGGSISITPKRFDEIDPGDTKPWTFHAENGSLVPIKWMKVQGKQPLIPVDFAREFSQYVEARQLQVGLEFLQSDTLMVEDVSDQKILLRPQESHQATSRPSTRFTTWQAIDVEGRIVLQGMAEHGTDENGVEHCPSK